MPHTQGQLRIVAALACELKAFICGLQLTKVPAVSAFDLYVNRTQTIYAIVTGIGKVASSAATAFLHGFASHPYPAYLNMGIAGGAQAEIGQLYQIGKITDQATQTNYYPSLIDKLTDPITSLISVDQVQPTYPAKGLVDMEASGFFATARRLVNQEMIDVCKVVSDNEQSPPHQIKPKQVTQWVDACWPQIEARCQQLLIRSMKQLAFQAPIEPILTHVKQQYHCTLYQQHQLRELVRRWWVQKGDQPLPMSTCTNVRQLLQYLTEQLDTQSYDW